MHDKKRQLARLQEHGEDDIDELEDEVDDEEDDDMEDEDDDSDIVLSDSEAGDESEQDKDEGGDGDEKEGENQPKKLLTEFPQKTRSRRAGTIVPPRRTLRPNGFGNAPVQAANTSGADERVLMDVTDDDGLSLNSSDVGAPVLDSALLEEHYAAEQGLQMRNEHASPTMSQNVVRTTSSLSSAIAGPSDQDTNSHNDAHGNNNIITATPGVSTVTPSNHSPNAVSSNVARIEGNFLILSDTGYLLAYDSSSGTLVPVQAQQTGSANPIVQGSSSRHIAVASAVSAHPTTEPVPVATSNLSPTAACMDAPIIPPGTPTILCTKCDLIHPKKDFTLCQDPAYPPDNIDTAAGDVYLRQTCKNCREAVLGQEKLMICSTNHRAYVKDNLYTGKRWHWIVDNDPHALKGGTLIHVWEEIRQDVKNLQYKKIGTNIAVAKILRDYFICSYPGANPGTHNNIRQALTRAKALRDYGSVAAKAIAKAAAKQAKEAANNNSVDGHPANSNTHKITTAEGDPDLDNGVLQLIDKGPIEQAKNRGKGATSAKSNAKTPAEPSTSVTKANGQIKSHATKTPIAKQKPRSAEADDAPAAYTPFPGPPNVRRGHPARPATQLTPPSLEDRDYESDATDEFTEEQLAVLDAPAVPPPRPTRKRDEDEDDTTAPLVKKRRGGP